MSVPPIYVINLERTPERKLYIQRQLDALGLSCCFVNAIDKYELHSKDYRREIARYLDIEEDIMEYKYKTLKDRGFPVMLSHIKAHHSMVENNIPAACILEDDSYLLTSFPEVLASAMKRPWDILKLSSYGKTPNKIMVNLFKSYSPPMRMRIHNSLIDIVNYKKNYPSLRPYTAYLAALGVIECYFDVVGNYLYFNTRYGKFLKKKYAKTKRINIDEPGTHFWLPRYYSSGMGTPLSRNKASWHKITAKHYIANPAEATGSGTAYMIRLSTVAIIKQVAMDPNLPIQHIDAIPWILYRHKGIKFFICSPPCVKFTYQYLINSVRYRFLGKPRVWY